MIVTYATSGSYSTSSKFPRVFCDHVPRILRWTLVRMSDLVVAPDSDYYDFVVASTSGKNPNGQVPSLIKRSSLDEIKTTEDLKNYLKKSESEFAALDDPLELPAKADLTHDLLAFSPQASHKAPFILGLTHQDFPTSL